MLNKIVKTLLLPIILIVILGGCANEALKKYNAQVQIYDDNFQMWENSGINHYRFILNMGCWCGIHDRMPSTVEVANGKVVSVTDKDGKLVSIEEDPDYNSFDQLFTVEGLFDHARQAISEADDVEIEYDKDKGFPTSIGVDWDMTVGYDDNIYISVSNFEVLP
jgi:hypothetical protein